MNEEQLRLTVVLSWAATTLMGFVVLMVVRQRDLITKKFWEAMDGYNAACKSNRDLVDLLRKLQLEEKDEADWWKEGK